MALVMERSPKAFSEMDEESIRQHFLVQLNGQYEDRQQAKHLTSVGKTDILVRVEGQDIFIAECAFWKGEKYFTEKIETQPT